MITVIVPTRDSAAVLGPCLSALVRAAVSGLVREVFVADAGSGDATLEIADDAGARIVGSVAEAVAAAKGDWIMVLAPETRLEPGWEAEVALHVDRQAGRAACFRLAYEDAGVAARLREMLAKLGGRRAEQGLLVETTRFGTPGKVRTLNTKAFIG
ncbi:MAG: glycosyltransferase [Pseudomonadota bacterium]